MKTPIFKLSSLSHKYIVALAGAFLMTFLVVHLTINLLMLTGDRQDFDQAVNFLRVNPFIKIMEYVLFAGFLIHILLGVVVWLKSRWARPVKYHVAQTSGTSPFSKFMIHSGFIILVFLLLHFYHFFFINIGLVPIPPHALDQYDFYSMAVYLFRQPLPSVSYLVSFVFLGFHLYHGFSVSLSDLRIESPEIL